MIGAVTDDFTGTASAGVLIAKSQVRTGLFFDARAVEEFQDADRLEAIFVSSNSRHLKPDEAYREVRETTEALKKIGVQYFSKKIDTTLRGGIGYEIDAMLDTLDEDMMAVMVTAMPQSKRICVGGFSIIDGVILTETPVAHDVKTPVRECFVPDLVQQQTRRRVDLITIKTVMRGKEAIMSAMIESRDRGSRILVIDSMTMEHIDLIAQACTALEWKILAVDPGAFTMKLNYRRGLVKEERSNAPSGAADYRGKTALFIVGSANPLTKTQIMQLCRDNQKTVLVPVSPVALLEGKEAFKEEVDRTAAAVRQLFCQESGPQAIVIETALHDSVIDLKGEDRLRGYEQGTCSGLINDGLAEITDQVLETVGQDRVAGLLLTGGDTMERVCRKLEVSCIQAVDNIVAQVDVGRIMGKYDGLPVIVKGGFCGYEAIGADIVKRLFQEAGR